MDECHRKTIEKYRDYLIDKTRFEDLWKEFHENIGGEGKILCDYKVDDILSTRDGCARNERFYDLVQTCDHPLAFKRLCNSLSSSGHNDLSRLLLEQEPCLVDTSHFYHHPHLPPLLNKVRVNRTRSMSAWASFRERQSSYFVQSSPRGYLLLINMRFVSNPLEEERKGSEVDVQNLKQLFTQLDYKIVEHHDLTLPKMEQALHAFSNMNELSEVDSVLVFIMSHGRNPSTRKPEDPPLKLPGSESVDVVLEDNKCINSNDIVEAIKNSSTIRPNIPKLFFFNVCRGSEVDKGYHGHYSPAQLGLVDHDSIADTSTQVDAQPSTEPHPIPSNLTSARTSVRHSAEVNNDQNTVPNGYHENETLNGFDDDRNSAADAPHDTGPTSQGNRINRNLDAYQIARIYHGNENGEDLTPTIVSQGSNIFINNNIEISNGYHINSVTPHKNESNGFHCNRNDSSMDIQGNKDESIPPIGNHSNENSVPPGNRGNENHAPNGFHVRKDVSVGYDEYPESVTGCCCFCPRQKSADKSKNRLVRSAVWLSRKFKCSMPAIAEDEAAVSSFPSGSSSSTGIPDSQLSHDAGVLENLVHASTETLEASITITRTSSKASTHSTGPHFLHHVKNMISDKIKQERRRSQLTGDIFMAFSTVDGYNSKRHPTRGSWFVTLICQVFSESAKDTDLSSMMDIVDTKLKSMFDARYGTQMYVKKTEGFNKKFFFNVVKDRD